MTPRLRRKWRANLTSRTPFRCNRMSAARLAARNYISRIFWDRVALAILSTRCAATPNVSGASVLPEAAAANPAVFYDKAGQPRSLQQIYQHFAQKFDASSAAKFQVASAAPVSPSSATVSRRPRRCRAQAFIRRACHYLLTVASGFHSAGSVGNIATSGSSTMFTAMMLGQMNDGALDPSASLNAINQTESQKEERDQCFVGSGVINSFTDNDARPR